MKPQFELTRSALNKKGIVKSDDLREDAIARVTNAATFLGFRVMGVIQSPIEGGDGNIEFLLYLKKGDSK